jgi:hypothetical protein
MGLHKKHSIWPSFKTHLDKFKGVEKDGLEVFQILTWQTVNVTPSDQKMSLVIRQPFLTGGSQNHPV